MPILRPRSWTVPCRRVLGLFGLLAIAIAQSGCGSQATGLGLDVVPQDQLQAMGLETWQKIRATTPVSQNAAHKATAQRVADRVLRAAGEDPSQWEVVVFASDEANAFALPGRKIGVYEGMFSVATSDDELAAVIGHEVGHLEAGHPGERASTAAATQLGVNLASTALGGGNSELVAAMLGAGAHYGVELPYSRNQELEADRLGLQYMAEAGYDPRAAIELWRKMSAQGGARPPTFLSTHPAPEQRIEALERQMPEALARYPASGH
jgi:predicted Zn-dependent protease